MQPPLARKGAWPRGTRDRAAAAGLPPSGSRVPAGGAMASPRSAGGGAGVAGDEAIWRMVREAGFDEEFLRRRDKAALIPYISRLESEIFDYQHNLGLSLLERKELASKYEQLRASSESAEIMHKRKLASQQSALAHARKRKKSLRKTLGIQQACVANLEKALHDMRGERAEIKISCETKLAEALQMMETAQKKIDEAEEKLLTVKSLEAESFELEEEKLNLEAERKVLLEEKNKLDLKLEAIVSREEALIQKESVLDKRESESLILQESFRNHTTLAIRSMVDVAAAMETAAPVPARPLVGKVLTLQSCDGEEFQVEELVAMESQTIKHMIEDDCVDNGIPLPNVSSRILSRVIEYCRKHVQAHVAQSGAAIVVADGPLPAPAEPPAAGAKTSDEEIKNFDAEFVKVDQSTLFDLILAANYLNIKGLLDLTCQTLADMIKGKTTPQDLQHQE